ncbi:hypothetical protein M8818_006822 [Zalaria obscura]|uniref:Uncharacterized protein n=1 Tax=Zalaria obscura TaxID=2024903 RepID=A0ACC3S9E0_9PEZI
MCQALVHRRSPRFLTVQLSTFPRIGSNAKTTTLGLPEAELLGQKASCDRIRGLIYTRNTCSLLSRCPGTASVIARSDDMINGWPLREGERSIVRRLSAGGAWLGVSGTPMVIKLEFNGHRSSTGDLIGPFCWRILRIRTTGTGTALVHDMTSCK